MKTLALTQGLVALIDDEDYEAASKYKWFAQKCGSYSFYVRRNIGGGRVQSLQEFLIGVKLVDHIDCNGLNNQRSNLRVATRSQQLANTRKIIPKTSKFKGVMWDRSVRRWRVKIMKNRRSIYIGVFRDEIEAAIAYDKAALELFGEFARINFPSGKVFDVC